MFAIKRALKLNKRQTTSMAQHAGFRRVVYNDALMVRMQLYDTEIKASDTKVLTEFKKVLTNHTKKQPENAWMNKMSSRVYQNALRDLADAFSRFRSGKAKHPRPARKKDGQSFTVDSSSGKVVVKAGNKIKIPTLGTFRLHEPINCDVVSQTFTISKLGERWYVSFCVDADRLPVNQPKADIGIDVGVKTFTTLSDGQSFDAPKPYKLAKTKLAKLQRKASRQIKGSSNQRKTYQKISKLHAKIVFIRKDFLHKLTIMLARTYKVLHIEDLNVKGMLANHKLAGAIADLGFYEFKRQLEYKAAMYGSRVILVDQWYPSSKTCSNCGHVQPIPLNVRSYDCPICKISLDRDLNAAINILNWQPQALRG